jgi:hypothetical protein
VSDVRARDPDQAVAVLRTAAIRHHLYQVLSVVEWYGHRQELILVPDGAEWFSEIPVLGVAT